MPEITDEELKAFTELKASLDDISEQLGKVKGKNEELLGEKKKAQAAQAKSEEDAVTAKNEKLKANGDFEELLKSTSAELEKEREINQGNLKREAEKEISLSALKIASSLADGENIGLLSEFVNKRLKYSDGGVKVLNKDGELTISTIDELSIEIKGDARFASLLKGVKSSGGGATGGSGSGASDEKLTSTQKIAEGLKQL